MLKALEEYTIGSMDMINISEYRKINTLFNWDKNPRAIKKDKFEELKNRVKEEGQFKPLIITNDGEVIGGNMRLRVYNELGIEDVWVSVVHPKNEAHKIRIALMDNEEMGYYEDQALAELIAQYKDEIDLTKYSVHLKPAQTLAEILQQFSPDEVVEDEVPEVAEDVISELGKVYQLGRHRVMCGDSTKIEDVERLMDGKKADMVFTDPPYGIKRDNGFGGFGGFGKPIARKKYDGDWDSSIPPKECFDLMMRLAPKVLIFGGNFFAHLLPQGKHWIVWDKKNTMPTFGDAELVWTNIDRDSVKIKQFEYNGLIGKEKEARQHATQKPLALIAEITKEYSEDENIVVDLFLGSGSTLIACEQTNRTCYGMELDPKYVDVIRKRYAKFIDPENWESNWVDMTPNTDIKQT